MIPGTSSARIRRSHSRGNGPRRQDNKGVILIRVRMKLVLAIVWRERRHKQRHLIRVGKVKAVVSAIEKRSAYRERTGFTFAASKGRDERRRSIVPVGASTILLPVLA